MENCKCAGVCNPACQAHQGLRSHQCHRRRGQWVGWYQQWVGWYQQWMGWYQQWMGWYQQWMGYAWVPL